MRERPRTVRHSLLAVSAMLALLISAQLPQSSVVIGAQATVTSTPTDPPLRDATEPATSGSRTDTLIRQWASDAKATSQYSATDWNAKQATGEPDTETCGDNGTAWASSSAIGLDSLTVYFDQGVTPTQINIYQTYNPGAITSVELLPFDDSAAIKLPGSADPGTDCPGVFTLNLTLDDIKPITGVRINLDQTRTNGWNEIDAVELVGVPRNVMIVETATPTPDPRLLHQWASDAEATSQYGSPDWSAQQAVGEPDTETCDDNRTAWASALPQGQDSLTVYYERAVYPTQINIHQTFNPGAITSVKLLPADGSAAIPIPDSADSGTSCPGIFSLTVLLDDIKPINGVRITLDQTLTRSWNEIDAVELVGRPAR